MRIPRPGWLTAWTAGVLTATAVAGAHGSPPITWLFALVALVGAGAVRRSRPWPGGHKVPGRVCELRSKESLSDNASPQRLVTEVVTCRGRDGYDHTVIDPIAGLHPAPIGTTRVVSLSAG